MRVSLSLALFVLTPAIAYADADGDFYTVNGGDCDDSDASVSPGTLEVCDGIDNDCDGAIDEIGATPVQCNSFPSLQAPADSSASGAFMVHVESFVDSVDFTGIPIFSNTGVGLSSPGGPETQVHSILVRNWQGDQVSGAIDADFVMTFPAEVTILGWVAQFAGGTPYVRDLDTTFSTTGGDLSIPGFGTNMELNGAGSDAAFVVFDQAEFDSLAGAGGADEARLLVSYDPVALTTGLSFTVAVNGTLQNVIHCDSQLPGATPFVVDLATIDPDLVDADTDGFTACSGDCDDGLFFVNPSRPEFCDAIDNNCDGTNNEGFDADGDGYFDGAEPQCVTNFGAANVDCDDGDAAISPAAVEICTGGIDEDCDGDVDAADADCATGDDDDAAGDDDDDSAGDDDDDSAGDDDDSAGDDDDSAGDDDDATGDDDDSAGDDDDATGDDDDSADDDATSDDDDSVEPGSTGPDCGCEGSVAGGGTAGWAWIPLLMLGLRRRRS